MNGVKEEIYNLLRNLPDDCTLEDVQYHLYILQKIERGLADVEAGRVYTHEEAERYLSRWLKPESGQKN